jgi:hypothetical protein
MASSVAEPYRPLLSQPAWLGAVTSAVDCVLALRLSACARVDALPARSDHAFRYWSPELLAVDGEMLPRS